MVTVGAGTGGGCSLTAGQAQQERTVLQLLALPSAAVGCKRKYPGQHTIGTSRCSKDKLNIPALTLWQQERMYQQKQAPSSTMGAYSAAKVRVGMGRTVEVLRLQGNRQASSQDQDECGGLHVGWYVVSWEPAVRQGR